MSAHLRVKLLPASPSLRPTRTSPVWPYFWLTLGAVALCCRGESTAPVPIHLEAENGALAGGAVVGTQGTGFSGTGFVTHFKSDTDRVTIEFSARAGLYAPSIRYRSPLKGFHLEINGQLFSGTFRDTAGQFAEMPFGKVLLTEGDNTVSLFGGWKGYEIDRIDFNPVQSLPLLPKPRGTLCDAAAGPSARALMAYLLQHYGERTLSGAIVGPDIDYVRNVTGKLPAIVAGDMTDYTTAVIGRSDTHKIPTETMLEYGRKGHIISFCWHWRSPTGLLDKEIFGPHGEMKDARWYRGFYTYATTFDIEAVLAHPEGPEYALVLKDIDLVSAELKKFSDAGIPVLWRPLHESEGRWFWWGTKGPASFVKLWRLVYDRITRVNGLHNLIWIYTGGANSEWYPGDDVVDIIGIDAYPPSVNDPLSATWDEVQQRFGATKLIALSEFGGVPDVPAVRQFGVTWSYFASWVAELGPKKMPRDDLKRIYNDPHVINYEDLPRGPW